LVICDNVSTDATPTIAQRFAQDDPRFIYRKQDDFLNAKDNFIRAYQLTNQKAKYFLWACDDNIWHPTFLAKTVEYMESHLDCSACGVYLHHFGNGPARRTSIPIPAYFKASPLIQFAFERMSLVSLYSLMRRSAIDNIQLSVGNIRDYPDRYYLAQLRALGHFHVVEEDLLGFRDGGISSTGDDPWVKTIIDTNFAEEELRLLFSLPALTSAQKITLAMKWSFIAHRHNIPNVANRWWLTPIHFAARIANMIRPSPWRVTDRGLQRVN
jgi:glycosyltransferase involved in cell wall biosynthesis